MLRFTSDGERQLRAGIEAQVRQEFKTELAAARFWRRLVTETKIRREIRARLNRQLSPYSLWNSMRF